MRKFAQFIITHSWLVIITCLVATLFFGSRLKNLEIRDTIEHFFLEDDPSIQFYYSFLDRFETDEFFLVAFSADNVYSPASLDLIKRLTDRLEKTDNVEQVISLTNVQDIIPEDDSILIDNLIRDLKLDPVQQKGIEKRASLNPFIIDNVVSRNGKTTAIMAQTKKIADDSEYRKIITTDVRKILAEETPAGMKIYAAGGPIFFTHYIEHVEHDIRTFIPLTFVILSVLMYLIYRRWRTVWLPMICITGALIWTMGTLELTGRSVNLVTTIIPPLLLVIGLAVIVHILNRYGEEYRRLGDREQALIETICQLFKPCFLTSLTTSIGFASLGISRIAPVRETGLFAAFGVMTTFAIAITLAPAILAKLAPPRIRKERNGNLGFLHWLLVKCHALVIRRPKSILLGSAIITIIGLVSLFQIKLETNLIEYFKPTSEIRKSFAFLHDNISGANSFQLFIEGGQSDSMIRPDVLLAIEDLQRWLEKVPSITTTQSMADLVKMMNRAFHNGDQTYYRIPDTKPEIAQLLLLLSMADDRGGLDLFTDESFSSARISSRIVNVPSPKIRALIADIEAYTKKSFPPDIRVAPTGDVPLYVAMEKNLVEGQIRSFSIAMTVIILCIMIFFGSIRVGLYSLFPNIVPILLSLGLMGLAGIRINLATCMIPSIAIGIAVDDTIHLLSRFRSEYRKRGSTDIEGALYTTLTTTGRAMVITSIALFAGFLILLASDFQPNMHFGLLTAFTMVWALMADLLTAPALLVLLRPKKF